MNRPGARAGAGAVAAAGAALLAAPVASAAETGPYFDAGVALGWTRSVLGYSIAYPASGMGPAGVAEAETSAVGPSFALSLEPGWALTPTWALGPSAEAELFVALGGGALRYSTLDAHLLGVVSAFVARRFEGPLELRLHLGWARAGLMGSGIEIGAVDNVFHFEPMAGPAVALGLARRWDSGWGVELRVRGARVAGEYSTAWPVSLLCRVSWSSWASGP